MYPYLSAPLRFSHLMGGFAVLMVVAAGAMAAVGAYLTVRNQEKSAPLPPSALALWAGGGALVLLALLVGNLTAKKWWREARAGWNLVPVLTASRNLAAGTQLTSDALTERPVPEQFVTPSVFRPSDRARVMGRALVGAVKQGEAITELTVGIDLVGCPPPKP